MGVGDQRHVPVAFPSAITRYPLYMRLSGPQGRSGRVRKISPLPGFDPRTLQAVACHYTDWAIPALINLENHVYSHKFGDPRIFTFPWFYPEAVQVSSDPNAGPIPIQIHSRLPLTNYTQFPTPLLPHNFHVFTEFRCDERLRCQQHIFYVSHSHIHVSISHSQSEQGAKRWRHNDALTGLRSMPALRMPASHRFD